MEDRIEDRTTTGSRLAVRRTTAEDLDRVMAFYMQVIDEMQGTDFDVQWRRGVHPSDELIASSTERGECIIGLAEDGEIACAMIVNHADTPGYEAVPWGIDAAPGKTGVIHVLATLPEYHHCGFGKQLIAGAVELSREAGLKVLRLDMLRHNWRGRKLYESCGFTLVGTFPLHYQLLGTVDLDLFELAL